MPGLPIYENVTHHRLDGHAIAEPMTRSDHILPPSAHADELDIHVPGPADGIGHDALAACVEPVTPGGRHLAERARKHLLQATNPAFLDVNVQFV